MNKDRVYYNYVLDALSRGSLPELLKIWQDSLGLGSTGTMIRTLINNALPELARINKVVFQEGMTFADFPGVRQHQVQLRCQEGIRKCLRYYTKKEDMEGIRYATAEFQIKFPQSDEDFFLDTVARIIGRSQNLDFVKAFLSFSKDYSLVQATVLETAAKEDNWSVLNYLLGDKDGIGNAEIGLNGALQGGHWGSVHYFLEKAGGVDNVNWDDALDYAARSGKREVVDWVFEQYEDADLDQGLFGAAVAQDRDMIDYFLEKGAQDYNLAFEAASIVGNLQLLKFFEELGASDWASAFFGAVADGHLDVVQYILQKKVLLISQIESGVLSARNREQSEIEAYLKQVLQQTT